MADYNEDFKDVYKPGRFRFKSRASPQGPIKSYMRETPYPASVPEPVSRRGRANEIYADSKLAKQKHLARLERMLGAIVSAEALVFGLVLFSGNLTGMATGNLTKSDANISGAVLFVIGVIGILLSLQSLRGKR